MPKIMKAWLEGLTDEEAKEVWEYFDGSFTNCEDVTETIAQSHRELCKTLCGHYPEEEVYEEKA